MDAGMDDINEQLLGLLQPPEEGAPQHQLSGNLSFALATAPGQPQRPTPSPFAAVDAALPLSRVPPMPQAKCSLEWEERASTLASPNTDSGTSSNEGHNAVMLGPLPAAYTDKAPLPPARQQDDGALQHPLVRDVLNSELSASFSSCSVGDAHQRRQQEQQVGIPGPPSQPAPVFTANHNLLPFPPLQQLQAQGSGTAVAAAGAVGRASMGLQQVQPPTADTATAPAMAADGPCGSVAGQSKGTRKWRGVGGPPPAGQWQQVGADGMSSPTHRRTTGRYKRPEIVQAEKKKKAADQARIRQLEQLVGQLQEQLQEVRKENGALKQKSYVLTRKLSFKNRAEETVRSLQRYTSLGACGVGAGGEDVPLTPAQLQAQLAGASRGLPPQPVIDYLRKMTLPQAVELYKGLVQKLRVLLDRTDNPSCAQEKEEAEQLLVTVFTRTEATGMFGYMQIVNPRLMAQLMAVNLDEPLDQQGIGQGQQQQQEKQQQEQTLRDGSGVSGGGSNKVQRTDRAHWRRVLDAMRLTDEQMAQLILLLQLYCQRMEQLASRKADVARRLCSELTAELQMEDLEFGEVKEQEGDGLEEPVSELSALMEAEYWAKFDFMGCARKLLPPAAQARCIVASYPFHLDLRQFELAIKEKAGQMWRQLVLSTQ